MATKTKTATKKTSARKTAAAKQAAPKTTTKKKAAAKQTTPKAAAKKAAGKTSATKTSGKQPAKKKDAGVRKMTALDAAAKVLGEAKEPLNAKTMIERMAAKKHWTSPGGKTPHATLYAAILREINAKRKDARFAKTDRGLFTLNK